MSATTEDRAERGLWQDPPVAASVAQFAALGSRFVVWRYEPNEKGGLDKMPYQTNGMWKASSTNQSTWSTLPAALEANRRLGFDGVGLMLGDLGDGRYLAGVDWDAVRSPTTGEI